MQLLKVVALNILIFLGVGAPLVLIELFRSRSEWLERNHGWLSLVALLILNAIVFIWVLPRLGLQPNPRFFDH